MNSLDQRSITLHFEQGREQIFVANLSEHILDDKRVQDLSQLVIGAVAEYEQITGDPAPNPLPVLFMPDLPSIDEHITAYLAEFA